MNKTVTNKRDRPWIRPLACVMALGLAWPGFSDVVAVEAVDTIEFGGVDPDDADLLLLNTQPGFALLLAEEDLQKQMAQLNAFFEAEDWAKAFRLMTDLDQSKLQVMVPLGGEGRHVLMKEELQRQLLSLPVSGRRAFQLYFDAQAQEALDKIKNHPFPGSDDQLTRAQSLVDRLLASSAGGEAAILLGDMYFGRGLFDQAERSWQLAIDVGYATGKDALELQAKRAIAMQRSGRLTEAKALSDQLKARYGQATINAGGQEVDALAMLGETLAQPVATDPLNDGAAGQGELLPKADASPIWHLPFLDQTSRNAANQARGRSSWYSPPSDILKFVPPVVADDKNVYFHWLGVVFSLDQKSGKINWLNGSIKETAEGIANRFQSNHGDPRNYRIAIAKDTLLVTSPQNAEQNSAFTLKAYDTTNGQARWTSDARQDWSLGESDTPQQSPTSLLGQMLIHEGWGYAVVTRLGQTDMFLRRFSPLTGAVDWTIPLGGAETISFQYTQVSRMPQPTLSMGPSLLYVMTNNGGLLGVDVIAGETKWAFKTDVPFGIGARQNNNFIRGNQLGDKITTMSNTNGSGRLLVQDNTLYVKEHNSKTLYALDPITGIPKWSADKLMPDAKLIGVDDKQFYVMDRALQSYAIDGEHDRTHKNGVQTGSPDHAGAILLKGKVLLYANGKLRQLDTKHLDPAGKYENPAYLGQKGGHLYVFGELLIAIDTTQITAFQIPSNN
ncbi:MAG: PQQ-binding-like beta-propeller repeat protein [Phycisphaeraceae bacterium]